LQRIFPTSGEVGEAMFGPLLHVAGSFALGSGALVHDIFIRAG